VSRARRVKVRDKFNRLTVVREVGLNKYKRRLWECLCECGGTVVLQSSPLFKGLTRSCGCLRREQLAARQTTHGKTQTSEYRTHHHMIDRCYNPNDNHYYCYGARGIRVCDRWLESFENFYEDMGPKPSPEYSIDRIDNDGNYEPSNCQWLTLSENTRKRNLGRFAMSPHDVETAHLMRRNKLQYKLIEQIFDVSPLTLRAALRRPLPEGALLPT
jgi:hypothetical protein